jgi:hypothetical protein
MRRLASLGLALVVLGGCSLLGLHPRALTPPTQKRAEINTANQTTLNLAVFVNGTKVADYAAGAGGTLDADQLPPLPWSVAVKTVTGRTLAAFDVQPADLQLTIAANGGILGRIPGARVDLSCGTLRMWAGDQPMSGPPPGPGTPGDCEP